VSKSERDKGRKGEAEVARIWREAGAEVRNLEATGDHLIICAGALGPELHSECKRQETARPWAWWEQASSEAPLGTMPVVHFRRNRSPWLAMVNATQLAGLLVELGELRRRELERGGPP
jgi:hypothetical protein